MGPDVFPSQKNTSAKGYLKLVLVVLAGLVLLLGIPWLSRFTRLRLAQGRWELSHHSAYTVSVSYVSFGFSGAYRLNVSNGVVTQAGALPDPISVAFGNPMSSHLPDNLKELDFLTVGAMFNQVEEDIAQFWAAPWFGTVKVRYHPDLGYPMLVETDANGIFSPMVSDSNIRYTAGDLEDGP